MAVVSPFIDKRHGTERRVAESLNRTAELFEIHVYSQHVEDLDLSRIVWHRIPAIRGPHLLNYAWWFMANHVWRVRDKWFRNLCYDLIYSPGINCLDADAISVNIMFAELLRRNLPAMRFRDHSLLAWPRLLHRHLYYRLIVKLERRIYPNPKIDLNVISRRVSDGLQEFYGREGPSPVVHCGLDGEVFNPKRRLELRESARREFHLEVMEQLRELPLQLLVVGQDDPSPYESIIRAKSLAGRIHFLPLRKDVEFYYAASDVYAGPSKEDAFGIPPLEAMACGLPLIVSRQSGVSELVTHGVDGYILENPEQPEELARLIANLYEDAPLRHRLSEKAAETARQYTWERSARELGELLLQTLEKKNPAVAAAFQRET